MTEFISLPVDVSKLPKKNLDKRLVRLYVLDTAVKTMIKVVNDNMENFDATVLPYIAQHHRDLFPRALWLSSVMKRFFLARGSGWTIIFPKTCDVDWGRLEKLCEKAECKIEEEYNTVFVRDDIEKRGDEVVGKIAAVCEEGEPLVVRSMFF